MNKKLLIPIIGIITILITLIGWRMNTYSALDLPYPKYPEKKDDSPPFCVQTMANEMALMRKAWYANLEQLKQQQKPTSAKTDEAYESMRTYRCWLDYLCEEVYFSGLADEGQMKKEESENIPFGGHIYRSGSCVNPITLVIPTTKIKFLPDCYVSPESGTRMADAGANYRLCRDLVQFEFGDPPDQSYTSKLPAKDMIKIIQGSSAMVAMESFLKNDSASQKGMILQNKIQSILTKTQAMGSHIDLLKEYMTRFDSKLACFAPKCD